MNSEKLVQNMVNANVTAFKIAIENAPYDKTVNATVEGKNLDGTYKVNYKNNIYSLPLYIERELKIFSTVKVVIPENQMSNAFIL